MGAESLSIGQASAHVGVAAHVLRHWEAEGVLAPDRTPAGHRLYGAVDLARIRLVQRGQAGGLSLAQIRDILATRGAARRTILETHRDRLRRRAQDITAALQFVEHALDCSHPVLTDCSGCQAALNDRTTSGR